MPITSQPEVAIIPLAKIQYGDRRREDFGDMEELKRSVKEKGLIHPIAVKRITDSDLFLLLAGGRRWKACTELALETIPVRIYDHDLTPLEIKGIELEENLQRKNMTWDEEVKLKKDIHDNQTQIHGVKISTAADAPGWSKRDTANLLGESHTNLINDIQLASMVEQIPALAKCETKDEARKLVKKLTREISHEAIAKEAVTRQASTPIEVLRRSLMDSYLLRDCLEGIKELPEKSIDIVEIDPPYAIDLTTNKFCWQRGDKTHDQLKVEDYNEMSKEDYPAIMKNLFKQCYRVMKENTWLILWFAPDPWFGPMIEWLREAGFLVKAMPGIWTKRQGQTNMPSRYLATSYEMFFYARKGDPQIRRQGRLNEFEYSIVPSTKSIHPTERPVELIEDILSTFALPNSKVLVPFLGSGNTLLAAYNLGMTGFGYDLTPTYRTEFITRCTQFTPKTLVEIMPKDGMQK